MLRRKRVNYILILEINFTCVLRTQKKWNYETNEDAKSKNQDPPAKSLMSKQ